MGSSNYPAHIRVRVDTTNTLSVHTPNGALPFDSWLPTVTPTDVRIVDLDLVPLSTSSASSSTCPCGRPASTSSSPAPAYLAPLAALSVLEMVRRWTPHSCAVPKAKRVVNLDCTALSSGGEGDEFRLEPAGGDGVVVYSGLWEYDEFPRFVVEGALPRRVVVRVMAPGDEDEVWSDEAEEAEGEEAEGEGEEGEGEGEGEGGEGDEEEGEWEDEDEDEEEEEEDEDPAETKIRALMAQTKYLPLVAFITSARASTHFTLVDVEAWDEDEDGVEGKIRGELEKAFAKAAAAGGEEGEGKGVDEVVRFVGLAEYRAEVGGEVFSLEGENVPPWSED